MWHGSQSQGQRWTLARVATVIARRFHVRFSQAQTWRILRQMGWTVQVPVRRAAERDEEAVATWIKETLMALVETDHPLLGVAPDLLDGSPHPCGT